MVIYGLFVGVNIYESHKITWLRGCENDVYLISGILKQRYAIPDQNCLILLNKEATKRNVINGFQEHLAQAGEGDTAIFYFSGHGSQENADPSLWCIMPDRHSETLVCYDSHASEPYDLADTELRYLIYRLSQRGVNVVTIIDSCHSGDAIRDLDETEETGVRLTPGEEGVRPLNSYIFFNDLEAQDWLQDFTRMPEGRHIAISACRSDQLSKERYIYETLNKQGVFTSYAPT